MPYLTILLQEFKKTRKPIINFLFKYVLHIFTFSFYTTTQVFIYPCESSFPYDLLGQSNHHMFGFTIKCYILYHISIVLSASLLVSNRKRINSSYIYPRESSFPCHLLGQSNHHMFGFTIKHYILYYISIVLSASLSVS